MTHAELGVWWIARIKADLAARLAGETPPEPPAGPDPQPPRARLPYPDD